MTGIKFKNIPKAMRELRQWVLWKNILRDDRQTKVPFQTDGDTAKANDESTWASFSDVCSEYCRGGYDGIGFVFTSEDPFVGVDLDGCRDPESGAIAPWAREIIDKLNTYAEVSPSGTGVKLFAVGSSPFGGGKKISVPDVPAMGGKSPAIEIYDSLRYFAMTGHRGSGPHEPQERQEELKSIAAKYWKEEPPAPITPRPDFHSRDAIVDRARKYVSKLPPAISGQGGHNATFHAACVLVLGFELSHQDALDVMLEFNDRCSPPWTMKDLERKVREAAKQNGQRGYLKNASPANWSKITVPSYSLSNHASADERIIHPVTLKEATAQFLDKVEQGQQLLFTMGVSELDRALGGGVEQGEMIVLAARPSHGKSAVGLQAIHSWTLEGHAAAMVSEEMSAITLGRRTVQFVTPLHEEHWRHKVDLIRRDIELFNRDRAECYILPSCGTAEKAIDAMNEVVDRHGVKCIVVDYAQLLRSPGKTRYEQVTNTSIALRQFASSKNVVLVVLCQLNRESEKREAFTPLMSDLRDSGQIEQDADVVTMMCWPWRVDKTQPPEKFEFYNYKNRNRGIHEPRVTCRFVAARQMIVEDRFADEPHHV